MQYTLGVIMDPIAVIKPHKDTSLAMMLEAQRRGATVLYFELKDIYINNGKPMGLARTITVRDQATDFYTLGEEHTVSLGDIDVLLMRKDPPSTANFYMPPTFCRLLKTKVHWLSTIRKRFEITTRSCLPLCFLSIFQTRW